MPRPIPERPDIGGAYPEHVAVIMDGNGRWAQQLGVRRAFGHRRGARAVREITTNCAELGLGSLTLYAFSSENWKRPQREVKYLMRLLRRYLIDERATLMRNGVRLQAIGHTEELPADVLAELHETERLTGENEGLVLRLALCYGARTELADATRAIAEDARSGVLDPANIDESTLRQYLYDPVTPDPDLLIRTAGERRLSNFLLWQISYAEFHVAQVCWPEFEASHLMEAFRDYACRTRTYGGLSADPAAERARAAGNTP